jgi:hypothetical protein
VFKVAVIDTRVAQATKFIQVKDHTYLAEHLERIGITLEELNFFTWQAFPNRSYGKFLVSEKEWSEIIGAPATGNRKARLIIEDANNTKEFSNLDIVSTSVLMTPIYPTGVNGQDGSRILILELEHTADKYHRHNRVFKQYQNYSDLVDEFIDEQPKLRIPEVYNQHVVADVPLIEYLAHIAASNFFTVFLPPANVLNLTGLNFKPKLTDAKFNFPTNMQLLYTKTFSLAKALKFKVIIKDDRECEAMGDANQVGSCATKYYESEPKEITLSDNIYKSPINANTDIQNIEVVIPYALIDHIAEEITSGSGDAEVNAFADDIEPNAKTRLLRNIDVIYQGLVPGDITNDIQSITYYFQDNNHGLRTRLKSIPWEMPTSQSWIRHPVATEAIYKAFLLTNMGTGGNELTNVATAVILNMQGKLIEIEKEVFDSTGIFAEAVAGMTILVSRDRSNCRFHVLQSQCIPESGQTPPIGRCCVSFQIENGPGLNHCIDTTQQVCLKLNGVWTLGQTCAANPCGGQ